MTRIEILREIALASMALFCASFALSMQLSNAASDHRSYHLCPLLFYLSLRLALRE